MEKNEYLEKFDSIVKAFSKEDKIALIHDLDADGVSSGAITYNAIKLLIGKEIGGFTLVSVGHRVAVLESNGIKVQLELPSN